MELVTRAQLAKERGVSLRTIIRHLVPLELAGTIKTYPFPGSGCPIAYEANEVNAVLDQIEQSRAALTNSRRWLADHLANA